MKEQSNGAPGNLIAKTVSTTAGLSRTGARAELIVARRPSPPRGRIHLRRPTFFPSVLPCSRAADHTFGYDSELIENDELDESALVKLQGIVKISHTTVNGTSLLNLDGYAPAERWPSLSDSATSSRSELAS